MELNSNFYFQLEASAGPLYQAMGKVAQQSEQPPRHPLLQVQSGRAESPAWFLVQAAEFEPEPLAVETIRVRDIYASEAIVHAILEMLAAEKWLDRRGGSYHLTASGKETTETLLARGPTLLKQAEIPAHIDLNRLENLLRRILDATLACDDLPGNWCLVHSRNRSPSDEQASIVKLFQYFSDFNAFRDDAHMAAWQPTGVKGYEWEAFAFVIGEQATSAASLHEQLSYRGYSTEEYSTALANLAERGWLTRSGEIYAVTEAGKTIHADVEGLTDHYFYQPWTHALSEAEMAEVVELLRILREEWQ